MSMVATSIKVECETQFDAGHGVWEPAEDYGIESTVRIWKKCIHKLG